ncbi:cation:proton antiporter [Streptomyces sp. NPDC051776]|uniref:cation:proton antiporter domain-containing protein n=1 Tax=Streptomyces sp. NPDC051776 TaxID=3155414 RepID=UPI0034320282
MWQRRNGQRGAAPGGGDGRTRSCRGSAVPGASVPGSGFGWVKADLPVEILSLLGLSFLLFLAGLETDVHRLRGRRLRLALGGYGFTLAIGAVAGLGFGAAGWVESLVLIAITLSGASSGLIASVLKGAGVTRPIWARPPWQGVPWPISERSSCCSCG